MKKRIVILGAGESGSGSAVLAVLKGFEVFVSDRGEIKQKYKDLLLKYDIPFEEGQHSEEKILLAEEVIKSPGIPDKAEIIQKLKAKHIPIISEIEFAGRYTTAKNICITGSNGKTTTTLLLHYILKKAGLNVGLAGNVGSSYALQVALENHDYYVIELSSFQLDGMFDFRAYIAILMNVTPDHLDRYDYKLENYTDSKFRITQNQRASDYFIYCADDEITSQEVAKRSFQSVLFPFSFEKEKAPQAYVDNGSIFINQQNNLYTMTLQDLALQGKHNVYNSMAAAIASNVLLIRKERIRECLSDFQGVEHRLEYWLKVHGIQFINDSKATNVNSTWYALESMPPNTVWIVGGIDKGNDYSMLKNLVKEKVKAIVCLGVDNSKIHAAFGKHVKTIVDTTSMREAVRTAYSIASKDETVLLSPACASFDLFENYEDRGRQFKNCVRDL
ncbi:MAG: UDP-N-acetylmuramoyl-L-alanine--D-glutamate ligase [Bacteroidales bacterium]|nr:UDP-N-acetylmuramoyl-L-alanine--D-glutamate ligase [Bacteroidales bacterium]MCF8454332.1 UDP-N-acetylmuramoyl-L-alanine--D-glutamate ligase [Bacteroidales bacterium]